MFSEVMNANSKIRCKFGKSLLGIPESEAKSVEHVLFDIREDDFSYSAAQIRRMYFKEFPKALPFGLTTIRAHRNKECVCFTNV